VRAREDPIASSVAYAHQVERMARKNEAFNAFLNIDQASPTPQLRRVAQDFSPIRDQVTLQGFLMARSSALLGATRCSAKLSTDQRVACTCVDRRVLALRAGCGHDS
jgi:hypothetical protein